MHCVIGSGPAGAACAHALLQRGAEVLMLDAGLELEPDRARIVHELASTNSSNWPPAQVAALKAGLNASAKGVPLKLLFGSDYPYRETEQHTPWQAEGIGLRPSLARGGLSTVWGAAMMPYRDADLEQWPLKTADLAPHYRAAIALTGLAGQPDDLAEDFPLYHDAPHPLSPSRQAQALLDRMERHRIGLRAAGWRFGRARLAVRASRGNGDPGCVYCGLCMHGCPYGYIYNSADTVRQFGSEKRFTYRGDVIVTALREEGGKVRIEGRHRRTREPLAFEARRVYLAAGVIPTAQILLRSKSIFDRPLRLRDSQYFLFPLVLARRTREVQTEALHTLSQLFVEISNPDVSRRTVHLQLYTYSDLIGQAVRHAFGPLARLPALARRLEERLIIVQGYLHSDESPGIELSLQRAGQDDCLRLRPVPNAETRPAVKRVLREVLRQYRRLGGVAVPPLLQLAEPGRGFHTGGSFPMRSQPGPFESDCLGRPHGWERVHAVDATVLPSIPATTITLSVMANAHRIGQETAELP